MNAPTSPVTIRPLGAEHRREVRDLDLLAFATGADDPDADLAASTAALEWDRVFGATLAADRPDAAGAPAPLAGVYAVYSLALAVPDGAAGAVLTPMAGLTWVGVDPGRRRRGVASAMVRHHLHGLHEQGGEPVSGLRAAEAGIYGRFGYGLAATGLQLTLPRGAALRPVAGAEQVTTRWVTADVERHGELVEELNDRACALRPGLLSRQGRLRGRLLDDGPDRRRGREPLRLVLAERDGAPTGYALLRRTLDWQRTGITGRAVVVELAALDAGTHRALWGVLADLDLHASVVTPSLAADDPLLHLLVDVRAPAAVLADDLWLRLVDVDRALTARGYAQEVDVVLGIADALCPWNARRWRLGAGPDGAACEPTSDPAEVLLDVRDLGAAYLGGPSLVSLAAAGLVQAARPGALARLSGALRGPLEPRSPWMF